MHGDITETKMQWKCNISENLVPKIFEEIYFMRITFVKEK
jgi:hypothetical protein